ncbi:Retrovirus-related Pol polyprotein from transposon TNT 1-94 [Sesamum angolense]|uniref:Retrovirus-related Pol polyprotein from transposon TNT 1-94 n=1 Tax=Sesamum angolense TaxID=2727404 RepID=A0AAE1W0M5_9LAMI|nr:Retrovirus-related Pol polyprotein from transposon TNT 1-94 [Sesamum angolense]
MLSLVEKLEDLKLGHDNDTYIDVILQSLPPSYDPFNVNFNMNGLEKSINELINMLVQDEAMIKKSASSVLIWEASTSKAKGKRVGSWKRKKGKAKAKTVIVAKHTKSAPIALVGMGKGKRRMGTQQQSRANDICAHCHEKGHWKRNCPNLSSNQGLGHISQDRMKKLVDSKSLEIDNLDILLAYYLKENGIVSQWTPPGMPQLNVIAESRNRTLLDKICSMMSFTKLSLSLWGYALETAVRYYFYDPSKQKVFVLRNTVFLERGFPTDTQRDELLLEESSEAPQSNAGTSSPPTISTDNASILCRSVRVPQPPESTGLVFEIEESCQSRAYEDYILDMARGGCAMMGHDHYRPYPVQSAYRGRWIS